MGWMYLVWMILVFPVAAFIVKIIVGFMPYSHLITPLIYVFTVAAYAVLLGFVHIGFLERATSS
jgi:hypothetical protein